MKSDQNQLSTAKEVLQRYFGYCDFRPGQAEIVVAVLAGRDTLAILPTGGGKSLCFQVPGLVLGGTTIVVSPLISLMQDQVQKLVSLGIKATFINSSLSQREQLERVKLLREGYWQFLYLAPERLQTPTLLDACQKLDVKLLVIDEAHCISEWGHDFRPPYREIQRFVMKLPRRPIKLALTATATPATQQDVIASLHLNQPFHFFHTFKRPNLQLRILSCSHRLQKELHLARIVSRHRHDSGIIYVATRQAAEEVAGWLNRLDFLGSQVVSYHGGLEAAQRQMIQQGFITGAHPLIVATNAFGMGIDKPDIRYVIHFQLPGTLENYIQEIGRAGRDGETAQCYLLHHPPDKEIVAELNQPSVSSSPSYQQLSVHKWQAMKNFIYFHECRVQQVLAYFGEHTEPCGSCDYCQPQTRQIATPTEQRLFGKLLRQRTEIANQTRLRQAFITPVAILKWLALFAPQTEAEVLKLPGIGKGWVEQWWPSFATEITTPDSLTTAQPQPAEPAVQPDATRPDVQYPVDNFVPRHSLPPPTSDSPSPHQYTRNATTGHTDQYH